MPLWSPPLTTSPSPPIGVFKPRAVPSFHGVCGVTIQQNVLRVTHGHRQVFGQELDRQALGPHLGREFESDLDLVVSLRPSVGAWYACSGSDNNAMNTSAMWNENIHRCNQNTASLPAP